MRPCSSRWCRDWRSGGTRRHPGRQRRRQRDDATEFLQQTMLRRAIIIPVGVGQPLSFAWAFGTMQESHQWPDAIVEHLQVVGDVIAGALRQRRNDDNPLPLRPAAASLASTPRGFNEIVGESLALRAALARLEEVANTGVRCCCWGKREPARSCSLERFMRADLAAMRSWSA